LRTRVEFIGLVALVGRGSGGRDGQRGVAQAQPAEDRSGDLEIAYLCDSTVAAAAFVATQGVDAKGLTRRAAVNYCGELPGRPGDTS
jgi:hypothetical protein